LKVSYILSNNFIKASMIFPIRLIDALAASLPKSLIASPSRPHGEDIAAHPHHEDDIYFCVRVIVLLCSLLAIHLHYTKCQI